MKLFKIWILAMALVPVMACEQEVDAIDLAFEEAEIFQRDATRWLCGGGWFIATATDTFTVQQIPNAEIEALLLQQTLDVDPPVKVHVVFNHAPESTCAVNFDRVKEIREIQLRED